MKINGVTISAGTSGSSGSSGTSGSSGSSGTSGSSGSSGTSGSSGSSGTSGINGYLFRSKYSTVVGFPTDPGNGLFRFNNGWVNTISNFYVDDIDVDGRDLSSFFNSLTFPVLIEITQQGDPTVFAFIKATTQADSSGYHNFTISETLGKVGSPASGTTMLLNMTQLGTSGTSGSSGSSGTSGSSGSSGSSGTSGIGAFPVVDYNTTNLVLGIGDASEYLRVSGATAVTVGIPPQSSVTWPADTEIILEQRGAGQLTISGGTGVTVNKRASTFKSKSQYAVIALKRVSSDVWTLFGDLE